MKNFKRVIMIMGVIVSICFSGCGDENKDNDNLGEASVTTQETGILENEYFSYSLPDGWSKSPIKINDNAVSIIKGSKIGIDVLIVDIGDVEISLEEYRDNIEAGMKSYPGCEVLTMEIQERELGKIVYAEMNSLMTKDMVQSLIDDGTVKQEAVDQAGGIETYAEGVSLQEVIAYYMYDNYVLMIDGKCAVGGDIEEVKKQVNAIIDTIEVK